MRKTSGQTIIPNPEAECPAEIIDKQVSLSVPYYGFDKKEHTGSIEVHSEVADDVEAFFQLARKLSFPIERVVPASHPEFSWDDAKLMAANVSSGFNCRPVAGTSEPSLHSYGQAFDINPKQNPYIRYKGKDKLVMPPGAVWDTKAPGTLHENHPLVKFLLNRQWEWGGLWPVDSGRVDYQHFEKRL